jgi:hypothetical protein
MKISNIIFILTVICTLSCKSNNAKDPIVEKNKKEEKRIELTAETILSKIPTLSTPFEIDYIKDKEALKKLQENSVELTLNEIKILLPKHELFPNMSGEPRPTNFFKFELDGLKLVGTFQIKFDSPNSYTNYLQMQLLKNGQTIGDEFKIPFEGGAYSGGLISSAFITRELITFRKISNQADSNGSTKIVSDEKETFVIKENGIFKK